MFLKLEEVVCPHIGAASVYAARPKGMTTDMDADEKKDVGYVCSSLRYDTYLSISLISSL